MSQTSPADVGFALLNASGSAPRDSAHLATFLFGVLGVLLFIFFATVVITTVTRAMRRNRPLPSEPTDVSVDAWTEAGKRFGKKPRRKKM